MKTADCRLRAQYKNEHGDQRTNRRDRRNGFVLRVQRVLRCTLAGHGNRNVSSVSDAAVAHAGAPPGMYTIWPSVAAWMPCRPEGIGAKGVQRSAFTS